MQTSSLFIIFATSFMLAFSGAMVPGPLLTVTISETPRRGYLTGPRLILGHGLLELVLVLSLVMGLAPVLRSSAVYVTTSACGALVLVWLACGMIRALPRMSLRGTSGKGARSNLVVTGAMLSIANPYWTIWWVTIGLGYITHSLAYGTWGVIFFFAGHILADLFWYTAVSTTIWKGKRLISDRLYRWMIAGCAVFLLLFAGLFGYTAMRTLLVGA